MSEQHEPRNEDVRYEHSDVNSKAAIGFAAALAVWLAVVIGLLWGMFLFLYHGETGRKRSEFPIAEQRRQGTTPDQRLPGAGPIVEGFPFEKPVHSLGRYQQSTAQARAAEEEAWLAAYHWADAKHTIAQIPIAEAMKRLLGKLPVRKDAPQNPRSETEGLPTVSSSGRMPAGGPP
jgi:hypothetical protein